MVMASEVGVYDVSPEKVIQKGRLMPGKMLLVDTEEKRIIQVQIRLIMMILSFTESSRMRKSRSRLVTRGLIRIISSRS